MYELPDRRAIIILVVLLVMGILNAFVTPSSAATMLLAMLLAVALIGGGFAFVVLDLREGYCMNRPSITRDESPVLFYLEIVAALFLAGVGVRKLWLLV